ncbi:MAG TPA: hypothetical protein VFB34_01350 [Chloroflexota bacterium]|nr:hypothetical protein [Chloroflexota bacterium]
MWLYLAIISGALGSRIIPLAWRYRLATVIADLLWLIWTSKRRTCIDNMAVVLGGSPGDPEVRKTARRAFHQFGKGVVDFLGFANIDPNDPLLRNMPMEGWEHVEAGLARGRGVLLATGHYGSTDMGGLALVSKTKGFAAVADTFKPSYVDRLIRKTRESKGFRLIPATNVREILRALHANELVVVLFDRPLPLDQGVPVSFFGRETAFPAGTAVMAVKTGATVVPGYIVRNADNSFTGRTFPPATSNLTGDKSWDVRAITQNMADSLEAMIRARPDQWYMFRHMWPDAVPAGNRSSMREASIEAR